MISSFLKPNHTLLRKVAKQIPAYKINSKQMQGIVKKMLNIALGEQKDPKIPIMVGLAAPQIGIPKRIILVDTKADGKGKVGGLRIFINPEIIWSSKRKAEWYEGCYSISEVCGIVSRPTSIKIQAYTYLTHPMCKVTKFTGYVARILQHEIDHLNGKFFVDLINNPAHLHHVRPEEFPIYRNKMKWKNWPKKYPLKNL